MQRWFSAATTAAILHWMILVRVLLYSLVTLGTCWLTSTQSVQWNGLSTQAKVAIVVGCFVMWGNNIMAFLDKSTQKIVKGQSPFDPEGTNVWKKEETTPQLPKP